MMYGMRYRFVLAALPLALLAIVLLALPFVQTGQLSYAATSYYTIAFNAVPNTGSIVFNGNAYLSGNSVQAMAGNYPVNAVAPANFVFSNWLYTSNSVIANAISQDTNVLVSGSGTITANFNALTTFSENGLPADVMWSAAYNGIEQNAIAPNSINFSTLPGNYIFDIADEIVDNAIYAPTPQYGYLVAGNTTTIKFTSSSNSNAEVVFTENGLPSGSNLEWSVSYNGIMSIKHTGASITFRPACVLPCETGNATFLVKPVILASSNAIYMPSQSTGFAFAGNTITIDFTRFPYIKQSGGVVAFNIDGSANVFFNSTLMDNINISMTQSTNTVITISNETVDPNVAPTTSKVYRFIIINESTPIDNYVSNVIYTFSVPSEWVTTNASVSAGNIKLFKYSNGNWETLNTVMIRSNSTYYTYSAVSNSLSTYAVSFTTNNALSTASPISLSLPSGFKTYFWAGGATAVSSHGAADVFTDNWTNVSIGSYPAPKGISAGGIASIGFSTETTGSMTFLQTAEGAALAGIGANVIFTSNNVNGAVYSANTAATPATSLTLSYSVATSNSFVILLGAANYSFAAPTLPSGCTMQQYASEGSYAQVFIATCTQASGSDSITISPGVASSQALAAFVFPPYTVTLDDNPITGTITTNGNTYSNGNTIQVIGTNAITANPPATGNWVFNSWSVSNANLTLSSTTANPSTLTVMGNGIVTATWNSLSKFVENGLPSGKEWNVTYDGILNSSTTNTILFSTVTGSHQYTVPEQVVSGNVYIASPLGGYVIAGNTTIITFTQAQAPTAFPSNILYYVPMVLSNYQNISTPAPFQQYIPINALNYTAYMTYNSNFANFEYFYSNAMIVPAWIENNVSNTVTTWVNIANGIPAFNSITIYLGFVSNTVNLLSGSGTTGIGEAPEISPSYAEYDDGASVFLNYWNFAGNTLPSGWTGGGKTSPYYTVNNGLTVDKTGVVDGSNFAATISGAYNTNNILEFFEPSQNFSKPTGGTHGISSAWGYMYEQATSGVTGGFIYNPSNAIYILNNYGIAGTDLRTELNNISTYSSPAFTSAPANFILSMHSTPTTAYLSIGTNPLYYNNSENFVSTTNVYNSNSAYIDIYTFDSNMSIGPINYIRVRSTPPNDVMPSRTLGAITKKPSISLASTGFTGYSKVDEGQTQVLTASINGGGVSPYTYNFLVYNSINTLVANALYASVSATSDSFSFAQSSAWSTGTFTANVYIYDSGTNTTSNTLTYTVYPTLGAPTITAPTSPNTIYINQGITISASAATGGTGSYSYSWSVVQGTSCPGFSNPGNVLSFIYTPTFITSSCEFEVTATDTGTTIQNTAVSSPTAKITVIAAKPTALPSNVLYYVPIVLFNNQSAATPAPFQQSIPINALNYTTYMTYNSNFANFEYFYANAMIVPAWIERNASNTITTWVNIANGIPAFNSITIYLGFVSNTANLLSGSGTSGIGEAPQLTCPNPSNTLTCDAAQPYAEYDDGASVFLDYWNFAGNTLPSGWTGGTTNTSSATPYYIVDNGLLVNDTGDVNGENYVATTNAIYSTSNTLEFFMQSFNFAEPSGGAYGIYLSYGYSGQQTTVTNAIFVDKSYHYAGTVLQTELNGVASPSSVFTGIYKNFTTTMHSTSSTAYLSLGSIAPSYNNLQNAALTSYVFSSPSAYINLIDFDSIDSLGPFYYIRIRSTPPNGVMPSSSFSQVYGVSTFSENGLPNSGELWNVTYNSATQNAIVPNSIVFSDITGNYLFTVANQIVSGVTYAPTPSSGYLVTGNSTTISFRSIATLTSNFIETGLPSPFTWNVIYDSILNSSTTNTIKFFTAPGNYLYTVADQVVSGNTYVPSPSSGYLVAGNTTTITFSPAVCTISLSPATINFNSLLANSNIPTNDAVADTNGGSATANMLVYGGNWILSTNSLLQFGVSNTTWAASSNVQFASANKLTNTPALTGILIPGSTSNSIYFGLGVPGGTPAGSYSQTITIENSC